MEVLERWLERLVQAGSKKLIFLHHKLDFIQSLFCSGRKSERIDHALEKDPRNLDHISLGRRHREKGGGPEMLAHIGKGIGKGRQGFGIPSSLANRKRLAIQE